MLVANLVVKFNKFCDQLFWTLMDECVL